MTDSLKLIPVLLVAVLVGCQEETSPVYAFKEGEIVEFVISGQRAQIIYRNFCEGWKQKKYGMACTYDVRMVSPQVFTDTHVLSSDGPLHAKPLTRVDYVREYELRLVK